MKKGNSIPAVQPGDTVRVKMRGHDKKRKQKIYSGVVESVQQYHLTVNIGRYAVSVLCADLHCGQVMLEILEKAEEGHCAEAEKGN